MTHPLASGDYRFCKDSVTGYEVVPLHSSLELDAGVHYTHDRGADTKIANTGILLYTHDKC
jgi:hypothetical protein